jgi:hypothetical protein
LLRPLMHSRHLGHVVCAGGTAEPAVVAEGAFHHVTEYP